MQNAPRGAFCNTFMQVESNAECSKGSILQYFQPSISYHLALRPLFCLFLSGHLRQVSLYMFNLLVVQKYLLYLACGLYVLSV